MNFFKKFTFIIIALSLSFYTLSPLNTALSKELQETDAYIVLDSDSKKLLPDRFRILSSLNISGSSQPTPSQFTTLKKKINKPNLFIIDLRQESHGFINDFAISFYNQYVDLNNGFTTAETMLQEKKDLKSIPLGKEVTIYSRSTRPLYNVFVDSVNNEQTIAKNNNLNYVRFSVKDRWIPDAKTVDDFIYFVKNQVKNSHLHFHCEAGEGRTTLFLSMYQIVKNPNNLSLHEILNYQYKIGGSNLLDEKHKYAFLKEFYTYVQENKNSGFKISYSKWINYSIETTSTK